MKLKTKIQLFSSLFMLVLILIINVSIYFLFYKLSADSEVDELISQTDTIITMLNDNESVPKDDLLKAFIPAEGMIRVIPKEGQSIVHTRDITYFELPAEYTTMESNSVISLNNGEKFAVVSKPIIWSNGEVVTLQVSKNLVTLTSNMTVLFYVLMIASIIILIPVVVAGNVLSKFLLSPIQALIRAMKENTTSTGWEKIAVKSKSKDELYELEKAYNDMIDQLRKNYEKQEIFVSDASHELKTPISIVKSYAELIKRRGKQNPELIDESVQAISSEADRMQNLVEQMLSLAKNKENSHLEPINIVSICENIIASFNGAYNRTIRFKTNQAKLIVNGDSEQLKQVIYILIDNALKYSKNDVLVKLMDEGDNMSLTITDYGQGIAEADLDKIFERFYRVDKARSRDTGGTGLGLAIAKSIIQAHHGTLTVKSVEGEGTTFTINLPK